VLVRIRNKLNSAKSNKVKIFIDTFKDDNKKLLKEFIKNLSLIPNEDFIIELNKNCTKKALVYLERDRDREKD